MDINSLDGTFDNNYELENENNTMIQQVSGMNETGEVERFLDGNCRMEASQGRNELTAYLTTENGRLIDEILPFDIEKSIPRKYYDQLPEIMKSIFSENDFVHTEDGFLLCTKSIGDLFHCIAKDIDMDIDKMINNDIVPLKELDSWHLAGVEDKEGTFIYTLIKMKESNDGGDIHDLDMSFVKLDVLELSEYLNKIVESKELLNDIQNVLSKLREIMLGKDDTNNLIKPDEELIDYFRNPVKDGIRLIAEQFVLKYVLDNIKEQEKEEYITYFVRHDYRILCLEKKIEGLGKSISGQAKNRQDQIDIEDNNDDKTVIKKKTDIFKSISSKSSTQKLESEERYAKGNKYILGIVLCAIVLFAFLHYLQFW